jgi:hypothetical protein
MKYQLHRGVHADIVDHARQQIEHQQPPTALVAVVQALDGEGDTRNDDRDEGDGEGQNDADGICGEGKKRPNRM